MDGARLDRRGAGGGVADRRVAQGQRRRLPRHRFESRAQGGVLPAPAFHQRRVLGAPREMILDVAAPLGRKLAVDERVQIGFLDAGGRRHRGRSISRRANVRRPGGRRRKARSAADRATTRPRGRASAARRRPRAKCRRCGRPPHRKNLPARRAEGSRAPRYGRSARAWTTAGWRGEAVAARPAHFSRASAVSAR